jgi:hypothetical protein
LGRQGNLRVSYTLSRTIDEGVVNTSSPLVPGDFARERALGLIDSRHRLAASGSYQFPRLMGGLMLSGFNLSSADRSTLASMAMIGTWMMLTMTGRSSI